MTVLPQKARSVFRVSHGTVPGPAGGGPVTAPARRLAPIRIMLSLWGRSGVSAGCCGGPVAPPGTAMKDRARSNLADAGASAAVDEHERAEARPRVPLAAPAEKEAHGRSQPTRGDEPDPEGAGQDERQPRAHGRHEVGRPAQGVDGARELLAPGLDLAPELLRRGATRFRGRHCRASPPRWSASPPRSPDAGRAESPA